jgi:hypothetical protein
MAIRKKQGNGKEIATAQSQVAPSVAVKSSFSESAARKDVSFKKTADACSATDMQVTRCSGGKTIDNNAIAHRAWEIWQREGCPEGRALEHWLRAERELSGN